MMLEQKVLNCTCAHDWKLKQHPTNESKLIGQPFYLNRKLKIG